jgi:hypothetical protein
MHRSCAARYFLQLSNSTNRKTAYPCPACKQEWNKDDVNSILKGNKVNEANDSRTSNGIGNKKQRTSGGTNDRSIRSSNRRIINESDDED